MITAMSVVRPAAIFAFDLLWYRGKDCRARPLIERKAALAKALKNCRRVIYGDHFKDSSAQLWDLANRLELEGIMARDAASPYTAGRTSRWLKIKTDVGEDRERTRRP